MLVAIPSKGRPDRVKSQKLISSAFVFVPAIEAKDYLACGVGNVVPVPDEIRGITPTRNWILDWAEKEGHPRVVFIDDDVKKAGYCQFFEIKTKHRPLDEAQWLIEWAKLFDTADQLGFRIWGTDTAGEPRAIYPYRPFIFHTYVTASCMGMWSSGPNSMRFDEEFIVKEDYEICLRCLKEDGGVLGARYLYWANEHWIGDGGCRSYRTQKMELKLIKKLIKMYPGLIRRVEKGGSEFSIKLEF